VIDRCQLRPNELACSAGGFGGELRKTSRIGTRQFPWQFFPHPTPSTVCLIQDAALLLNTGIYDMASSVSGQDELNPVL